jgi:hypothetical protein
MVIVADVDLHDIDASVASAGAGVVSADRQKQYMA